MGGKKERENPLGTTLHIAQVVSTCNVRSTLWPLTLHPRNGCMPICLGDEQRNRLGEGGEATTHCRDPQMDLGMPLCSFYGPENTSAKWERT